MTDFPFLATHPSFNISKQDGWFGFPEGRIPLGIPFPEPFLGKRDGDGLRVRSRLSWTFFSAVCFKLHFAPRKHFPLLIH